MNQATPYELLIAQKLQELAVPEQADAIWATIEHQLNIEMPTNSSPGSGGSSNTNWWIGGSGLFTFTIAVLTYVFVSKQNLDYKTPYKEIPAIIQPVQPEKTQKEQIEYSIPSTENSIYEVPANSDIESGVKVDSDVSSTHDSISLLTVPIQKSEALPIPEKLDTTVTKEKARGVKGLGDGDYRLVPGSKKNRE